MATLRARLDLKSDRELLGLLNGLAFASLETLREAIERGQPLPDLYASGVRYKREAPGKEEWQLPSTTYARMAGDCEDLAAWACAQRWLAGDTQARMFLKRVNPQLRHIQVLRGDGTIEDPSRALGMGRRTT
jgi:hypothetical protein